MHMITGSREYVLFPWSGPAADLTIYQAEAIMWPEGATPLEPPSANPGWKPCTWLEGECALLVSEGDYPDGDYMLYGRITAGVERPARPSGRVRIGSAA